MKWPLSFLDFEAAGLAIPLFPGTSPYDAIPFQFSCHVQKRRSGKLIHREYLNTDGSDPRLYDLLPVIRNHYCHPNFGGSYSIKAVLPALVEELSYEGMDIADGMAAAYAWQQLVNSDDKATRHKIETDLRVYCGQDSLAMARLRTALLHKSAP